MNNKRLIAKIVKGENVLMTIDSNILSCEFGALDRGNLTDVTDWGIYANSGSLSFIDKTGYFNNENVHSYEFLSYDVRFYLAYNGKNNLISTFKIDSAEFFEETKQVDILLISKLYDWQNEKTDSSIYPYNTTSVKDLIDTINERFNKNISADSEFYRYNIFCPFFEASTLWNIVSKICQASMARIVEDSEGNATLATYSQNETKIVLMPQNIISVSNPSFVNIPNRKISVTKRQKTRERASLGYTINWELGNEQGIENIYVPTNQHGGNINIGELNKSLDATIYLRNATFEGVFQTQNPIYKYDQIYLTQRKRTKYLDNEEFEQDISSWVGELSLKKESDTVVSIELDSVLVQLVKAISYDGVGLSSYDQRDISGEFYLDYRTFTDSKFDMIETLDSNANHTYKNIQSNELVQEDSFYFNEYDENIQLADYILRETGKRYGKGIQCFDIECLFNEYRDESGKVVFDGKDLSKHFEKYDVIIPYVMKNGKTVPFSKNADGTPKKFRIIGISYSYDGLLKQKLSVQEERYDVD